jgi:dTDP-glucose pyrophosphorylase
VNKNIENLLISTEHTIYDAMKCLDKGAKGIVLVVDENKRLLATITDGDIRRALLADISSDTKISCLLDIKKKSKYPVPLTARIESSQDELLKLLHKEKLLQIPLLDKDVRVVGLAVLDDLVPEKNLAMQAVIMAGGFGKRLAPLTDTMPKPMLPLGKKPLLEKTLERLEAAGIQKVCLSTHYKSDVIEKHFGDGKEFGVELDYIQEDEPLGTAGALKKVVANKEPLLVINGDILTGIDFRAFLEFHQEHKADLTVAVRKYEIAVPYGVLKIQGANVQAISEKPCLRHFINAGIYLLNPDVRKQIPDNALYNMTDLIESLMKEKKEVVAFPIHEYWLDIGNPGDYEKAKKDVENGQI